MRSCIHEVKTNLRFQYCWCNFFFQMFIQHDLNSCSIHSCHEENQTSQPGVEPRIFWSVVRRVIHCATGPHALLTLVRKPNLISYNILVWNVGLDWQFISYSLCKYNLQLPIENKSRTIIFTAQSLKLLFQWIRGIFPKKGNYAFV